MKRCLVSAIILLLLCSNLWAARAHEESSIAHDPYISALLLDAKTGEVLFAKNPNAHVYPASVIKLMDLLVILDKVKQGQNTLEEMVQITPESAKMGGSQVYLDPKEQFSVDELLYALMVQSANDAAVALALHIAGSTDDFVTLMNQKAAELGMKDTHFYSVHGLPPGKGQKTDQSTASDLALLCRELVQRPDVLKYTSTREHGFRNNSFIMRNHNHLLGNVGGCDGLKTGYFKAAGFSIAATAVRGENRVIALVMGSKDRKVRDAQTSALLNKGLSQLAARHKTEQKSENNVSSAAPSTVAPAATAASEKTAQPPQPENKQVTDTTVAPQKVSPPAATSVGRDGFHWKTFIAGFLLGIIFSGIFMVLRKKRDPENFLGPRGLH